MNIYRKNPKQILSKEQSIVIKENLKYLKFKIDEYRWIILILKSIGDGIAYTFIHKLDIKPQNFKEGNGFISDKKGLILEKKILRYSYKNGIITILNDLTSVLKYADLTLITENGYQLIEAKTSHFNNLRTKRQKEKSNKVFEYLNTDVANNLYGNQGTMIRTELLSSEINYIEEFNNLIISAEKKGYDFIEFEKGFVCLIAYKSIEQNVFNELTKKYKLVKPIAFHLNMYKFEGQGYYPFSLTFNNPKYYWEFLKGNLNVMIFIDLNTIEMVSKKNNYIVERSKLKDYAFTFKSSKSEIKEFSMSEHYFFRSYMEMVSINWLMQDTFDRFNNDNLGKLINLNKKRL